MPAAGSGTRMGLKKAKQFMELCGKPILAVTLSHFQECNLIDRIVVAVSQDDVDYCRREIVDRYKLSKVSKVIVGGKRRQDSVRRGIEAISDSCRLVLIHDGVRPLATNGLIKRVIKAANDFRAVITGLPVKETVKEADSKGRVLRSIDRGHLWLIQTPQIFRWEDIHLAHQKAIKHDWEEATVDAVECTISRYGGVVNTCTVPLIEYQYDATSTVQNWVTSLPSNFAYNIKIENLTMGTEQNMLLNSNSEGKLEFSS